MQDQSSNIIIGWSKAQQGLYQLNLHIQDLPMFVRTDKFAFHFSANVSSVSDSLLWHKRLGHVPFAKMFTISQLPCKVESPDSPCDVCKFASF